MNATRLGTACVLSMMLIAVAHGQTQTNHWLAAPQPPAEFNVEYTYPELDQQRVDTVEFASSSSPDWDPSCGSRHCNIDCSSIRMGGWIQQGFTWNPDSPADRLNYPGAVGALEVRGNNDRANEYMLNQAYLYLEKAVQANGSCWDYGGRVDLLYGTDWRLAAARGLETHDNFSPKWNTEDHRFYGLAMPQLYAEFAAPVANGLSVKIGHFYSIIGYERIPAPSNFFYSRSYSLLYGEPFTHTGFLASLQLGNWRLFSGLTRGWDNWENPGREVGYLGGVSWLSRNRRTSLTITTHVGPELTTILPGPGLTPFDENQAMYSVVFQRCVTERLTYVLQHDFGYQDDSVVVANTLVPEIDFRGAKWYSLNQYLLYEFDECWSAGVRFEWFRDQQDRRILVPITFIPGGDTFTGGNYYAFTCGVNWRPWENVRLRTEGRWDWSDVRGNSALGVPPFRVFDDNSDGSQFLWGTDLIVSF